MFRGSSSEIGPILAKALTTRQVAEVLNALVGVDGDPRFTDRQAALGSALFDSLAEAVPEAVDVANGGGREPVRE